MPEIPILRLVTGSEVDEVVAWGGPPKALRRDSDEGVAITGKFHLTNGLECLVLGTYIPNSVDSWTADVLIHTHNADVELFTKFDIKGARVKIDPKFDQSEWSQFKYLNWLDPFVHRCYRDEYHAKSDQPRFTPNFGSCDFFENVGSNG